MQNTARQNYPGSVAFYDSQPGNQVGLFYNAPEPTRGQSSRMLWSIVSNSQQLH